MRCLFTFLLCLVGTTSPAGEPADLESTLDEILAIEREGTHGKAAADAARELALRPPKAIPAIVAVFPEANPLAANLLRSSVETIADRAVNAGIPLPNDELTAFAADVDHDPRARRLAYELVLRSDPSIAKRLIPQMLTDPGSEFRRDAVAYWIAEAERLNAAGESDAAEAAYRKALSGVIYDDQFRTIAQALETFGETVNPQRHFGFITKWQMIGPFDNRGMKGFETSYPPETEVDYEATYTGKLGEVAWEPVATDDPFGQLDLRDHLDNEKGTVMYLADEFSSREQRSVEIRLGTANAWKLWVNGEFLFGREEYHRGAEMDQYRVPATLKAGDNTILLKILQNEQTEDWAASFAFRLRVCDATGVAILPSDATTSE